MPRAGDERGGAEPVAHLAAHRRRACRRPSRGRDSRSARRACTRATGRRPRVAVARVVHEPSRPDAVEHALVVSGGEDEATSAAARVVGTWGAPIPPQRGIDTCYRLRQRPCRITRSGRSASRCCPRLGGRAALGRGEEVLERDVQEGAVGLGEQLVAVAQLAGDLDPPAAVRGHARRDPERPVDRDRAAVADRDPGGHGREPVPGREQPARLVERGADDAAVRDSRAALVVRART